ncbi:hypothetical protein CR513_13781, partial [Mucuna pruriens]
MNAFVTLKQVMTQPLVLVLPNFLLPFKVECDTVGKGIGAVLMQHGQPIASIIERHFQKETLPNPFTKKSSWLWSSQFSIGVTTYWASHLWCIPITFLTSPDQQCWLAKFEVKYKPKPGVENKAADALLRNPDSKPGFAIQQGIVVQRSFGPLKVFPIHSVVARGIPFHSYLGSFRVPTHFQATSQHVIAWGCLQLTPNLVLGVPLTRGQGAFDSANLIPGSCGLGFNT